MRKIIFLFCIVLLISVVAGQEVPEPVIQDIKIYGLDDDSSPSERMEGGKLVDSGTNKTFSVNHSERYREYRFEFLTEVSGDNWSIGSEDLVSHEGLDDDWIVEPNDIWYNATVDGEEEIFEGGSFSNGVVEWSISEGEIEENNLISTNYVVNISTQEKDLRPQNFSISIDEGGSDTDLHETEVIRFGLIESVLERPADTTVQKNRFFKMVANITCTEGFCGEVDTSIRYNESSEPDTLIPESDGEPFYTNTSNTKSCSNELGLGENCENQWYVNAAGEVESYHALDTNASSSFDEINDHESNESVVQINEILIVETEFETVDFGTLDPGENGSAEGNEEDIYNITVPEESNTVDNLWVRATGLDSQVDDSYSIPPENSSVATENDESESMNLSSSYQILSTDLSPGTVLTTYYWLQVPYGIIHGSYHGTIHFKVNSTEG